MRDVIIVKEGGGAVYTRGGENEEDIMCKAFFFTKTWPAFVEAEYDVSKVHCPDIVDNEVAWQKLLDLYTSKDRVALIRKMMESPRISNIMFCKEDELRNFLDDELFGLGGRQFSKKSSINNLCSSVRGLFRSIGREHSAEHGKMYKFLHKDLVFSANPMTTAIERFLEDKLEQRQKAQGKTSMRKATDKHAPPVSVVAGYAMMMMNFQHAVSRTHDWANGQIKQKERIINEFNLALMNAFLLHEGSRPIELQKHLHHKDLFMPLTDRAYWLTLVFLSPATLAYLWRHNKIAYYACGLYKGKDKQTTLYRLKSIIPCAFNSLDLVAIYTIIMKCMIALDPSTLRKEVFKQDLNLASLRARLHKNTMFHDAASYSYRYGAAREDKRGNINASWTRMRMGHSERSNMKDKYANSKDMRITYGGEEIPLGMDVFEVPSNLKVIALEMNVIHQSGCALDTQWLDQAFGDNQAMKDEFTEVQELVASYIEDDDEASLATLLTMFDLYHPRKATWLKDIPLGTHINIPNCVTTQALDELLTKVTEALQDTFAPVDVPRIVPELWSFPQVMYGNWRKILDIPDTVSPTDLIIKPIEKKKRVVEEAQGEPQAKKARVETESEVEEDEPAPALGVADIDPGDHVVIYCMDTRDPCRLKLPNVDKYVWIAKASGKATRRGKFTGILYANKSFDITQPIQQKQKETITITDDSVVWIFAAEDGESDFELTPENIKSIESRWE